MAMPYIYEMSFEISSDELDALKIGAGLERVLGYLRTLLPSETGYVTSRALYTVENEQNTRIAFWSEWEEWEDLVRHRSSPLLEDKILEEFKPHIKLEGLSTRVYNEIA
jgi:hypothetical protein